MRRMLDKEEWRDGEGERFRRSRKYFDWVNCIYITGTFHTHTHGERNSRLMVTITVSVMMVLVTVIRSAITVSSQIHSPSLTSHYHPLTVTIYQ